MAAETWQMKDPMRLHPSRPVIDDDSAEALQTAIDRLALERSPLNHGHAGLRLHLLASLIAQAQTLIPDTVADAREHGCSWTEIGDELGITADAARHRYSDRVRDWNRRRPPLELD
ncbi:MAG: hypothetical protein JO085_03940 [Acidimicrobiia bacterium]|nr:hypothetical protein [Acidimicrobiia bacterium]